MTRALAAAAVLVAALAFAPAALGHGILRREGDVLRYTAPDPGVGATLTISSPEPGTLEFFDTTSPNGMDWGPCLPVNLRRSRCPSKGVARVEVEVYDGDDTVNVRVPTPADVRGGAGADLLVGGWGDDVIAGGSGDDTLGGDFGSDTVAGAEGDDAIHVRDGAPDAFSCGPGTDDAFADGLDATDPLDPTGCEATELAPAPADTTAPSIAVEAGRVAPNRSGALPIPVALDEPGSVELTGRLLSRGREIGELARAEAEPDAPDQVWTLRVRVARKARNAMQRALDRGRRVEAELDLTAADAAGNPASASERVRVVAR